MFNVLMSCPGEPSECIMAREAIPASPWQALSEYSGITDHRLVMERSGSDMLHLTRKEAQPSTLKAGK